MPARVLVVGLDAAESTLLSRWASEGRLPALADLTQQAATYRLDNCWRTLPTAVWPELTSGRSPGSHPLYFPPAQLRTGEAEPRRVTAEEVDQTGFWSIASAAGRRVAAIDLPWTVPPEQVNGIFLAEWATHDRWFGTGSTPDTLVHEIREGHGDYPVHLCDHDYGTSLAERERLLRDLLRGVEYQTELLLSLLDREHWDLFACAYGQFQCVGHNFWGFMESGDGVPDSLRRAVYDVYAKIDDGLAALMAAAGEASSSVVVASHGMGPLVGGPQLLPEVVVRLGAGSGGGVTAQMRSRLPIGVRRAIRAIVPGALRSRLQRVAGSLPAPLSSAATTAVALPADIAGYVRLNMIGREPNGSVARGEEADAEITRLRDAFLELEQPETGQRIVEGVVTAREAFGPAHHPDVPDLMVSFRHDLGALDSCASERVGLVSVPHRVANRSGDHTGEARLWVAGPGIRPQPSPGGAHSLDVAPTILALLGVPAPDELDGRSVLAPAH